MRLRKLKYDDGQHMLEWMHDQSVVEYLQTDFESYTLQDCYEFIKESEDSSKNLHLAIVDDFDTYMGTVSLKHISNSTAEFAITLRAIALGKGYAQYGMTQIIQKGLTDLGLTTIYWCVNKANTRALRFYRKNNYLELDLKSNVLSKHILSIGKYTELQLQEYIWYIVQK